MVADLILCLPLIFVSIYLAWEHYTFWKQLGYYGEVTGKVTTESQVVHSFHPFTPAHYLCGAQTGRATLDEPTCQKCKVFYDMDETIREFREQGIQIEMDIRRKS